MTLTEVLGEHNAAMISVDVDWYLRFKPGTDEYEICTKSGNKKSDDLFLNYSYPRLLDEKGWIPYVKI